MNKKIYKEAMDNIHASDKLKKDTINKMESNKKNKDYFVMRLLSAICVFVFVLGIVNFNQRQEILENSIIENDVTKKVSKIELPTLNSYEKLKEILDKNYEENNYRYIDDMIIMESTTVTDSINSDVSKGESLNTKSEDYSKTNTQVEGVDEADIIKTDGNYIYYISNYYPNQKIIIIDTKTNDIVSEIDYEDFKPSELFIYKNNLVVIGNLYVQEKYLNSKNEMTDIAYIGNYMTVSIIYDISNKLDIKEIRRIEIEGNYISSRMIDEKIYLISSKDLYRYYYDLENQDEIRPCYRDTAISEEYICKDYQDIYYFPESPESNYLNIAGFSLNNLDNVNVETFLGAGNNIYCSEKNIYITRNKYNYKTMEDSTSTTCIYKIGINGVNLELKTQTEIPGYVNDQFSLDEYNGNLRVALTENINHLSSDTTNNLYVLDEDLNVIGKIENMAVGEKIYSVRFIGNKGYVVTFKQIDPLFVIDLSEPTNPKVAGELKIPGYSSYLHPYDENHIIGIGFNTKETYYGATRNDGIKMSMFDVTDPSNPIEMFNVSIGEEGTYSNATYNHKAIMYSKEKNIIAFPITSYNSRFDSRAIVYNIDLENGFAEAGTISNNGNSKNSYKYEINRIIYVGDNFYTCSNFNVKVTNMYTFEEIKNIEF